MSYDASVLRRARAKFDSLRLAREAEREETRRAIFTSIPKAKEIDDLLRQTVLLAVGAALRLGTDPLPQIERAREENTALQRELSALLVQNGYRPDALEERPACGRCGDTGFEGARMCECLRELCTREQIAELSHMLDLEGQSFDRFRFDCYSDMSDPDFGASPREHMRFVYEICASYAKNFQKTQFGNLFFSGGTGLGKTFLSSCIARVVSEGGHSVVYETAGTIFGQFETGKFSKDTGDLREAKDETRRYLQCDLLIMDDLGSEMTTPFVQSALYTLINTRLMGAKKTIISSNLSIEDVKRRYTPQIASRLAGEYRVLPFFGDDIRISKKLYEM